MSSRSATTELYRGLASLFAALVFVQAFLAGQFLNGRGALIVIHRALGAQILPLLILLMFALAVWLNRKSQSGRAIVVLSGASLIATMLQTGLGFAGRQSAQMAALHVPVGVALFGLAVLNAVLLPRIAAHGGPDPLEGPEPKTTEPPSALHKDAGGTGRAQSEPKEITRSKQ